MDVKQVFDTLARQEQPPSTVSVQRAMTAGRAARGRRHAAAAVASALGAVAAVVVAWSLIPEPGPGPDDGAVTVVSTEPSVTATVTVSPGSDRKGFAELMKTHPAKGRIVSVPPLLMWVSDGPREGELFLCESGPNGSSCSGLKPLAAQQSARTVGKLRGRPVWFGIARRSVHGVTAVTGDGRTLPARLTRDAGAGLGLWAVECPPGVEPVKLVVTDAGGRTLQELPA